MLGWIINLTIAVTVVAGILTLAITAARADYYGQDHDDD